MHEKATPKEMILLDDTDLYLIILPVGQICGRDTKFSFLCLFFFPSRLCTFMARRSSWAFSSVRVNGESHVSSILFYHFTNTHIIYYPGLSLLDCILLTVCSECHVWPGQAKPIQRLASHSEVCMPLRRHSSLGRKQSIWRALYHSTAADDLVNIDGSSWTRCVLQNSTFLTPQTDGELFKVHEYTKEENTSLHPILYILKCRSSRRNRSSWCQ